MLMDERGALPDGAPLAFMALPAQLGTPWPR